MKFNIYYIDCYQGKENLGSVDNDGKLSKNGEFKKFYNRFNAENYCAELTANDKFGCVYKPSLYEAVIEEYDTEENKTDLIWELLWELENSPISQVKVEKKRKGK